MSTDIPSKKQQANTRKTYTVTADQLPLSCPSDEMILWNSHPKVYLPIEEEGEVICSYCGAHYILQK